MASTGCVRTQTSTNANGEKKEVRWENVNIGGKGLMMASIGVTKTQTSTNANGEK